MINAIAVARNRADPDYDSPFAAHAKEAGVRLSGGKLDDVTVIVALVVQGPVAEETADLGKRDFVEPSPK